MTPARLLVAAFLLVALFAISGLRVQTIGIIYNTSQPLCGPYYFTDGRYAGDYGPCPTYPPIPPPETRWSWAPFWEPR
jgi:hypothetical protein